MPRSFATYLEYVACPKAVQFGQSDHKPGLSLEESFLEIDDATVSVTAMKKAEDNNDIIIRLNNPDDSDKQVKLKLNIPVQKEFVDASSVKLR